MTDKRNPLCVGAVNGTFHVSKSDPNIMLFDANRCYAYSSFARGSRANLSTFVARQEKGDLPAQQNFGLSDIAENAADFSEALFRLYSSENFLLRTMTLFQA
jgi:hypothetical protein